MHSGGGEEELFGLSDGGRDGVGCSAGDILHETSCGNPCAARVLASFSTARHHSAAVNDSNSLGAAPDNWSPKTIGLNPRKVCSVSAGLFYPTLPQDSRQMFSRQ